MDHECYDDDHRCEKCWILKIWLQTKFTGHFSIMRGLGKSMFHYVHKRNSISVRKNALWMLSIIILYMYCNTKWTHLLLWCWAIEKFRKIEKKNEGNYESKFISHRCEWIIKMLFNNNIVRKLNVSHDTQGKRGPHVGDSLSTTFTLQYVCIHFSSIYYIMSCGHLPFA